MADYGANIKQGSALPESGSRIQSDTNSILNMVLRVKQVEQRIVRHAIALGYYQPQPEPCTEPLGAAPISTSMAEALGDMDRAIDSLSGSLNLFD